MSMTPRTRRLKAIAAVCAFGLLAVACGDDDDTEASAPDESSTSAPEGEAAGAEYQEYCDAVTAMEEAEEFDAANFERIRDAAPDEIRSEVDVLADAFIAAEGDFGQVAADPAAEEALGAIEEFETEHCAGGEGGGEGDEEVATEPLEGAEVIPVTGVDFGFEGIPAQVPAGAVSFEFSNEGEVAHEMVMFKLGEGVDMDELLGRDEEASEDEAQEVGFTFAPPGEGGAYLNAEELTPGTYAVVCFIPGPEGKAHHELGMKTTFTVG
jgi:uncharacterized cupredoxin-like copper-binding protein